MDTEDRDLLSVPSLGGHVLTCARRPLAGTCHLMQPSGRRHWEMWGSPWKATYGGVTPGTKAEPEVVAPAIDGGDSGMRTHVHSRACQPWGSGGSTRGEGDGTRRGLHGHSWAGHLKE